MLQLRAEEVVRRAESIADRELAWERWAEKTCFFEKGTEIQHLLPAWVIMCPGWGRRGGEGPLRPSGREAASHTRQRTVFMCPSEGDCASPSCGSRYRAGGGAGEERGEESASPEPLVLCTTAPDGVTMRLKVIDFWDQDIAQFETQFKKKIDVSHSAVFG